MKPKTTNVDPEVWIRMHTDPATGKCSLNLTGEMPPYDPQALAKRWRKPNEDNTDRIDRS